MQLICVKMDPIVSDAGFQPQANISYLHSFRPEKKVNVFVMPERHINNMQIYIWYMCWF